MGGSNSWRTDVDGGDWMRNVEKRILHEERRPQIRNAADLLGPGFGPYTNQTFDWNSPETLFTGSFFSVAGAVVNSPDPAKFWIGEVLAQQNGYGIQHLWEHRTGDPVNDPIVEYTRRFYNPGTGGSPMFGPWVQVNTDPQLAVVDSSTIDFTLTGDGTVGSPWSLTGGVIAPSSYVTTQEFTAGGTWTKAAGAKFVYVRVLGGGGGGGGTAATGASENACAGGGGAGGYSEKWFNASALGATETVTVGTGGGGGAAGQNNGTAGGTSSFGASGTLVQATGGGGGVGSPAAASISYVAGGAGGVGSSGQFNTHGDDGGPGVIAGGMRVCGGFGGGSVYGGSVSQPNNTAGTAARQWGCGGSGASAGVSQGTKAGGAGSNGRVWVITYF